MMIDAMMRSDVHDNPRGAHAPFFVVLSRLNRPAQACLLIPHGRDSSSEGEE